MRLPILQTDIEAACRRAHEFPINMARRQLGPPCFCASAPYLAYPPALHKKSILKAKGRARSSAWPECFLALAGC